MQDQGMPAVCQTGCAGSNAQGQTLGAAFRDCPPISSCRKQGQKKGRGQGCTGVLIRLVSFSTVFWFPFVPTHSFQFAILMLDAKLTEQDRCNCCVNQ